MKHFWIFIFCIFLGLPSGCYYTVHSTSGNQVSSAQIQEIKLGQTTEIELIKLLGVPTKRNANAMGMQTFVYTHTEVKSITLPGGGVIYGLLDKEREEAFEVTLKDGVVQSYHFIKNE